MPPTPTFLSTDGEGYEAQMGRWSRRLAPLLIDFARLGGATRVVDIGCGTGSLTFALAQSPTVGKIIGVDLSPAYIRHATARNTDPRLGFEVGDACALRFADGSFDHALSSLVLQFVPDAASAIREMRRITRTGGTVAATTWDTRGGVVVQRMFLDTAAVLDARAGAMRAKACARPMSQREGLVTAWRDAGLLDVEASSLTIRMDFGSFDDFWSSVDGSDGPYAEYLGTISPDLKSKLRRLLEAAYLDGEHNGPRSYSATAWAVRGRVPCPSSGFSGQLSV
jgi:SAM-dependent methyltransferase